MAFLETAIKADDLAANGSVCVSLGEIQVGLFRTAEGLFAINNICPHRGAPLHEGFVKDGKVTCPWHQWDFRLSDGVCVTVPPVKIDSYPVEVREGTVWINLQKEGTQ